VHEHELAARRDRPARVREAELALVEEPRAVGGLPGDDRPAAGVRVEASMAKIGSRAGSGVVIVPVAGVAASASCGANAVSPGKR
jgi:hypothetical protein